MVVGQKVTAVNDVNQTQSTTKTTIHDLLNDEQKAILSSLVENFQISRRYHKDIKVKKKDKDKKVNPEENGSNKDEANVNLTEFSEYD